MNMHPQKPIVVASVIAAMLISAAFTLLGGRLATTAAVPAERYAGKDECSSAVTKTLQPEIIRLCEDSQVTVGLRPFCSGAPANIVFVIDEVYKPDWDDPAQRTGALISAVKTLDLAAHPNVRVGVAWMQGGKASKRVDLTNDARAVIGSLDVPIVSRFWAKTQCFECGYREAVKILTAGAKDAAEPLEIVLLAAMGAYTTESYPGILQGANLVKKRGAISMAAIFGDWYNVPLFGQAATARRYSVSGAECARVPTVLRDEVSTTFDTFVRAITVIDTYPAAVAVVSDSISPTAQVDAVNRTLTWAFSQPIEDAYTLTYRVKPLELGDWPLGEGASASLQDSHYVEATVPIPVPILSVPEDCPDVVTPTPTATRTAPPTDTATPLLTVVPTASPTATSTPPATPTRRPSPLYLPLALREQCVPGQKRVDVALVIDASTSMLEPTAAGPTKLETARAAVRTFLDDLRLDVGDQAAIIAFNADATVLHTLTTSRTALDQALDRIQTAKQTRIHRGIEEATKELTSARHRSGNGPAMIVLTDGRANPESPEVAVAQATLAKAAGITVFTIGIGNEVDFGALERMATRPSYFYRAPKAEDLAGIYREIARVIPCPPEQFWGRRP
jgi:Mg-chelatase subunit ChlD